MGNSTSIEKINFEDIQTSIKDNNTIIISTLNSKSQNCLIKGTILLNNEEKVINANLNNYNLKIIIYDKNCNEQRPYDKYKQLIALGFRNIYIYSGGLFEWLLLQDIYGHDNFPTTTKEIDILQFKPSSFLNTPLLTNID
tara:strand:- start:2950 stop:3369 length:420 start_codon:yes stop_codon:yes gene_type:complete